MSAQLGVEYPLAVVCRVLAAPRSSVYARQHTAPSVETADSDLLAHIERILSALPSSGRPTAIAG